MVDRCGNSGAGGTTCGGASAGVSPIFQLDTNGTVLKTFGEKRSVGLLSFASPGTTLALDFRNRGGSTLALLARLDAVVREAGGRLYPAKDGRIPAAMFAAGYPLLSEFVPHVDPGLSSGFWRRVKP